MSEPTTQAGKRLLALILDWSGPKDPADAILAIEEEARDEALMAASDQTAELIQHERQRFAARIEKRVREITDGFGDVSAAAVLRAIREEAEGLAIHLAIHKEVTK